MASRVFRNGDRARPLTAAAVGGAVTGAALWAWPAPAPLFPGVAPRLGLACRLPHADGVALTFDDGPHPAGTPATLELLEKAGVKATFFLVGEQVVRRRALAAEIASAGHEVGVHGYEHRLLLGRGASAVADDLERACELIGSATGTLPTRYRPPYGMFSSAALGLVRARGLTPVLWSRWGRDWSALQSSRAIARRATRGLAAGDVVLLHDADHYSAPGSWMRTVEALPAVLEAAGRLGVPLVTVSGR